MSEMLASVIEPLQKSATVRSVFGDPVSAQGKTIIPVARIAYGFGGGSGKGRQGPGEGQGAGGGVYAVPLGALEITDTGTRFISLYEKRRLLIAGLFGLSLGLVLGSRARS